MWIQKVWLFIFSLSKLIYMYSLTKCGANASRRRRRGKFWSWLLEDGRDHWLWYRWKVRSKARYTLPVSRVVYTVTRPVYTGVQNDARVHGLWTRVSTFWHPWSEAVLRPVDMGSVYWAYAGKHASIGKCQSNSRKVTSTRNVGDRLAECRQVSVGQGHGHNVVCYKLNQLTNTQAV